MPGFIAAENRWIEDLPTYGGLFPSGSASLIRSFSLFSLFRPSDKCRPSLADLNDLYALADENVKRPQVIKALSSFATFLSRLREDSTCDEGVTVNAEHVKLLIGACKGYLIAFKAASAVVWNGEGDESLSQSLELSLIGLTTSYGRLAAPDTSYTLEQSDRDTLNDIRLSFLACIFQPDHTNERQWSHQDLGPLFERARSIVTSLRTALRPMAHSKAIARTSPPPFAVVSETDALHIISLLHIFADGLEGFDHLPGPKASKTKAQKEEDKRRPMRIAMEARLLSCDVTMSMATREIKAVKHRAKKALPEEDRDEEDVKPGLEEDEEEDIIKWEDKVEKEILLCLETAWEMLEERRGGVLTDKAERHDWLGEDHPVKEELPQRSTSNEEDCNSESDDSDTESEEGEAVDMYPCPLRTLFRLHDRYEEQRLAVWMSLPSAKRGGMGSCMRGEGGKVGEAWDALGILLMLDYDSETLLNFGLSGDKLDKWVELASRRNAKKIRRKGRKTV